MGGCYQTSRYYTYRSDDKKKCEEDQLFLPTLTWEGVLVHAIKLYYFMNSIQDDKANFSQKTVVKSGESDRLSLRIIEQQIVGIGEIFLLVCFVFEVDIKPALASSFLHFDSSVFE